SVSELDDNDSLASTDADSTTADTSSDEKEEEESDGELINASDIPPPEDLGHTAANPVFEKDDLEECEDPSDEEFPMRSQTPQKLVEVQSQPGLSSSSWLMSRLRGRERD